MKKQKPKNRKRKHTSATKKRLFPNISRNHKPSHRRPWEGSNIEVTPVLLKKDGKNIEL